MGCFKRMFSKRGAIEELTKIIIIVVVLILMVVFVVVAIKGKGFGEGGILDSIKNMLRMGKG